MTAPVPNPFTPVVVAPTYNNARTLAGILARLGASGLPVIAVNDGCTDGSAEILRGWASAGSGRTVVVHEVNRGKADALRTGFEAAERGGATHAVTIDTDGQHDPEEVGRLVEAARANPEAMVIGVRSAGIEGYPTRSMTGRRLSNLFIRLECGAKISDSQSGFRVYPVGLVRSVRARAGRFGFETEIITRAAWAGCDIVEVPITSRYFAPGERVSHFRPVVDSVRAVGMHLRLLGRAVWPMPHRQWPGPHVHDARPWWRRLMAWLSPLKFWRQLHQDPESRPTAAVGFAMGLFLANTPLYGVHIPLGLYLAKRLNLHPLPVVAGCLIATPPLGPILIFAGVAVGFLMINGHWPRASEIRWTEGHVMEWAQRSLLEWTIGSSVIGLVMAVAGFMLVKAMLSRMSIDPPGGEGKT